MENPKKRIKLVVSDLHLGVGTTLESGQINTLEEFYFDEKFAEFIHFYTTGKYSDYEIELILNGDIFNFLQIDYRGHFLTVITEDVTLEILQRIVKGHPLFFKAIRELGARPGCTVTYVVGNHDQGMLWPMAREYLNQVLGVSVRYRSLVYFFDGVHIEHGHMYEAVNRLDTRKFFLKKGLPEPILNLPLGSHFFVEVVLKVKHVYPHVDKIRPFTRLMRWALFNETWILFKGFWEFIKYFIRSSLSKDPRKAFPLRKMIQVFLASAVFPDLSEAARRLLSDERIHTVIFGHSHVYQYRQWGEGREYFNTGTWTDLTSLDMSSLGKITKLTYVLLEYNDNVTRPRGRLKEWHGYHRIEEDVAIA